MQPAYSAEQEVIFKRDVAYGTLGKQKLDLFVPASATMDNPAPIFVFFHGGGWTAGSKDNYSKFARLIAQQGYIVALPNYRLYPHVQFPTFVEDAALAVKWVQENAKAMGGAPENIVLSGHSAGAHISSLLVFNTDYFGSSDVNSKSIRGLIGISGPYAIPPSEVPPIKNIFSNTPDAATMPITFVDGDQPPVLLLHGEKDWLVPTDQSQRLEKKITSSGSQAELVIFDKYKHIDIMPGFRLPQISDPVLDKILEFLTVRTAD